MSINVVFVSFAFCCMISLQLLLTTQGSLQNSYETLHFIKVKQWWLSWQCLLCTASFPTPFATWWVSFRANLLTGPYTLLPQALVCVMMESYSRADPGCASSLLTKVMTQPQAHWLVWLVLQLAVTFHLFPDMLLSVTTQWPEYPWLQAANPSSPEANPSPVLLTAAPLTSTPLWLAPLWSSTLCFHTLKGWSSPLSHI